ncbi:DUF2813 domain-containing protein, partial [Salmonella enterica subsp. enterica serovar Montevideo]|nr:DUF2813 domain-containing protein [Salmonella enterica subsp. enterica serovar Montevideo]
MNAETADQPLFLLLIKQRVTLLLSSEPLRDIFYRLEGECGADGSVMTLRSFLNSDGQPLPVENINDQVRHLV